MITEKKLKKEFVRFEHTIFVASIPKCDFCDKKAKYDCKTIYGYWATTCYLHFLFYALYPDTGKGKAQQIQLLREDKIR